MTGYNQSPYSARVKFRTSPLRGTQALTFEHRSIFWQQSSSCNRVYGIDSDEIGVDDLAL